MPEPIFDPTASPVAQAVGEAAYVGMDEDKREELEKEKNAVKEAADMYKKAREFDKNSRSRYAVDRRYAAGTADATWAVNTNLVGSMIDVLVSFLYARDPDVSVRRSPRVEIPGHPDPEAQDMRIFAQTMGIVISRLWRKGKLKQNAKRMVRSTLSVGPGWLKAVMIADAPENPEVQSKMNDLRDNIAALQAADREMHYPDLTPEQMDAKLYEYRQLQQSLEHETEMAIRKYMAFDFVAAQDIQVSLDVPNIEDYLDAEWISFNIYRPKSSLKKLFPRLTDEDCKKATIYHQRNTRVETPLTDRVILNGDMGSVPAEDADQYTSAAAGDSSPGGENGIAYIKIIERWNKVTNHIETWVDGVERWAKESFQPPYPTSRFYPCFLLTFYEVDGTRHPQSLSWRLHKLQDEYARSRSNFRISRERAVPATLFNATGLGPTEAKKIEQGVHQEYIGLTPTDPSVPLQNLFAAKPVSEIDPRLYDNAPILQDMEKIAGVQEALQSSGGTPKTATEANIQQSGFASRTTADRDMLETLLTELAIYTGEASLSALTLIDVQKIAGPAAFWPVGMELDDLLTLVEIEIEAGTTGKPRADADQAAWGVILPQLKEGVLAIRQAQMMGDFAMAEALTELIKETMLRMGDDTDISRFIPQMPAMPAVPGAPPGSGAPPAGSPALPPSADGGGAPLDQPGSAAPALANPSLDVPDLQPPAL